MRARSFYVYPDAMVGAPTETSGLTKGDYY